MNLLKRATFWVALFLSAAAYAQVTTATIGGRITDENGAIEGVTVVAIHLPSNTQYYATTDRHGWYQLLDVLPGGPYTLRIHYFSYDPLTVRNLYAYAGQNTVVDADMEAGTTDAHSDEAATSLRIGENLGGGVVPVAPGTYDLVGQRVYTEVPFDVRQEAMLGDVSRLQMTPMGTNRFHGSAFGYSGTSTLAGLTVSTPLAGDDFLLFGGLRYDLDDGLSGTGRLDARLGSSHHLDFSGGSLPGSDAWAAAGLSTALLDGRASNRAQAGWYGSPSSRGWLATDDFTVAAGAQRLLFGVQAASGVMPGALADSLFTRFDFYAQDAIRLGRRMTLLAGVRFAFPFAFSPRVSVRYDVTGTGAFVLRAGTAVYGRHGEGSVWKNLAAADFRLPARFVMSLEGVYGQSWRRPFYISKRNVLDSRYALTARLERPFADNLWAVASYTHADGPIQDRLIGGFSYKADYLGRMATTLTVLYYGENVVGENVFWSNSLEARLTQDIGFDISGCTHTLQLTAYVRSNLSSGTEWLAGLRYLL